MKRFFLTPVLAAVLFAAPAHVRAQDEGAKPDKKDETPEKKPPENPDQPRRQGRGGFGRQMGGLPVDQLKEKLGLSDDQVTKLKQIDEDSREEFRKEMQELNKDGNFDFQKMRELMPKHMAELKDKVKAILTPEQQPKFEEWVKDAEQRMRRGPGQGMGRDPESMKKRLMDQADKELQLTPDEKSAVMPLIQKVLDARAEARVNGDKRREEFTQFVKKVGGADEAQKAEVQKRLEEFRHAREADQQKVKEAQAALREVLTLENEAKLVALGILD